MIDAAPTPTLRASGASRAIDVLGDAWVLRLMRSAFRGSRRFSDFLRELDVSRAVLSERLERMVGDRLLHKVAPEGRHAEYRLTERGLDLWGVLIAMWAWERDWGTGQDESAHPQDRPRGLLVHRSCGHATQPVYACTHCDAPVSAFDTFMLTVPAAPPGAWEAPATQGCVAEALPPGASAEAAAQPGPAAAALTGATGAVALQHAEAGAPRAPPPRKRFRQSHSDDRAALPTLMRLYGDRWNSSVLAAALQGARTFSEFERALAIGPTQLSDRLAELQALGVLRARAYAGSRQEYRLTHAAIATFPITLELIRWGDRWLWDRRGPLTVQHRPCGRALGAHWRCSHCAGMLERSALLFGPPAAVFSLRPQPL